MTIQLPRRRAVQLLGYFFVLASVPKAWAQEHRLGTMRADKGWTRATPPAAPTGAGYLTLVNEGSEPDRLIGVTSTIARRAEIHSMEMNGDIARMRWLKEGVLLPPRQAVELKPGGIHIMLMELAEPIRQDNPVPVTLEFERAGKLDIHLMVAPIGARSVPTTPTDEKSEAARHGKH